MLDVAAHALLEAFPADLLEVLAANLEGVAAGSGVKKVGGRAGQLLAIAIELPLTMPAEDLERARVTEEVRLFAVRDRREVVAEVAEPRFDVQLVAQRAVPFTLPHPAARILLERRIRRVVDGSGERQAVGLQLRSEEHTSEL